MHGSECIANLKRHVENGARKAYALHLKEETERTEMPSGKGAKRMMCTISKDVYSKIK